MVCRRATQRRGLSEAKRSAYHYFAHTADLSALGECDDVRIKKLLCINCQGLFFTLNLALTKYSGHIVGADLSRTPPLYRPFSVDVMVSAFKSYSALSAPIGINLSDLTMSS